MTVLQATRTKDSSGATRSGRLFLLELSGDRIHSMNPDGSDRKTIDGRPHHQSGPRAFHGQANGRQDHRTEGQPMSRSSPIPMKSRG